MASPLALLSAWLEARLEPAAWAWLAGRIAALEGGAGEREAHLAFALAPRKVGKADLALSEAEREAADAARPGWDPAEWSVDQAARVALLLAAAGGDGGRCLRLVEDLLATADVAEQVCLHRGLPLYPGQELYLARAREGARTAMRAVFEAVAHRNPYPRERFAEPAWNHMLVKALFVGAPLWPIQGVDERANPDLARMLLDYAHERRAAGRPITPELWRCVGPFARGPAVEELLGVLRQGAGLEQEAAALALAASPEPAARDGLRAARPDLAAAIAAGGLGWEAIRP